MRLMPQRFRQCTKVHLQEGKREINNHSHLNDFGIGILSLKIHRHDLGDQYNSIETQ